jgi:HAE1 family hydrophobic/amphiphilic exporter-1
MTSLTTIFGLLPLAIGLGKGAELTQPLAIAVISGLIASTLLTLFIIPVIYVLVEKRRYSKTNKHEL